jgi:hypothetical protein
LSRWVFLFRSVACVVGCHWRVGHPGSASGAAGVSVFCCVLATWRCCAGLICAFFVFVFGPGHAHNCAEGCHESPLLRLTIVKFADFADGMHQDLEYHLSLLGAAPPRAPCCPSIGFVVRAAEGLVRSSSPHPARRTPWPGPPLL